LVEFGKLVNTVVVLLQAGAALRGKRVAAVLSGGKCRPRDVRRVQKRVEKTERKKRVGKNGSA
jgi:hypothetical protein